MSEKQAHVVLADNQTPAFMQLVKEYESSPGKYVEHFEWISKCIAAGLVSFTPSVYKNPGGRRPGEEWVPFNRTCVHSFPNHRLKDGYNLRFPMSNACASTSP